MTRKHGPFFFIRKKFSRDEASERRTGGVGPHGVGVVGMVCAVEWGRVGTSGGEWGRVGASGGEWGRVGSIGLRGRVRSNVVEGGRMWSRAVDGRDGLRGRVGVEGGRMGSRAVECGEIIHMVEWVERRKLGEVVSVCAYIFWYAFFSPRHGPASKTPPAPFTPFAHIHRTYPYSIDFSIFISVISIHFCQ